MKPYTPMPGRVLHTVASSSGLTVADLTSYNRKAHIAKPRHLAAYILHHHVGLSHLRTAHFLKRSDHTTIINSCGVATVMLKRPGWRLLYKHIIGELGLQPQAGPDMKTARRPG